MLGNFSYSNPTKLYFGEDSLNFLNEELPKYGKNVLLVYGGGSIKSTGLYDKISKILKNNNKEVFEDAGVTPNPTVEKLMSLEKTSRTIAAPIAARKTEK
jgi:alcohol dehydrogenase YqhD (iron-dependent ADH family)